MFLPSITFVPLQFQPLVPHPASSVTRRTKHLLQRLVDKICCSLLWLGGAEEVCGKGHCMRNPLEDVITFLRQTLAAPAAEVLVAETGPWSVNLC